jgi:hypothetical protein
MKHRPAMYALLRPHAELEGKLRGKWDRSQIVSTQKRTCRPRADVCSSRSSRLDVDMPLPKADASEGAIWPSQSEVKDLLRLVGGGNLNRLCRLGSIGRAVAPRLDERGGKKFKA